MAPVSDVEVDWGGCSTRVGADFGALLDPFEVVGAIRGGDGEGVTSVDVRDGAGLARVRTTTLEFDGDLDLHRDAAIFPAPTAARVLQDGGCTVERPADEEDRRPHSGDGEGVEGTEEADATACCVSDEGERIGGGEEGGGGEDGAEEGEAADGEGERLRVERVKVKTLRGKRRAREASVLEGSF